MAKDEEKNASDNNLVNAAQNDTNKSTPNIEQSTKTSSLGVVANDLLDLKHRKSLPGDVNGSAAIKSIPPWNKSAAAAINNAVSNNFQSSGENSSTSLNDVSKVSYTSSSLCFKSIT